MNAPMSTNVSLLPALPSCQPNPKPTPGCAAATSGLITLSVNALTRFEKAKATTNPTATVITSPRMTKSLNPLSTKATSIATNYEGDTRSPGKTVCLCDGDCGLCGEISHARVFRL